MSECPPGYSPAITIRHGRVTGADYRHSSTGTTGTTLGFYITNDPAENWRLLMELRETIWRQISREEKRQ